MVDILILYNPYYQKNVIKEHLKILIEKGIVAFGKIKSKLKDYKHPFEDKLVELLKHTDKNNYVQLFLTDYANIYVAKIIKVTLDDMSKYAPSYYKDLDVEAWFLIDDIYEIVRDDFCSVRDRVLSNFITPNYGNHTYALYGNSYVYPLLIEQKVKIDYFFESEDKFYKNIYKNEEYLKYKSILDNYVFHKYINSLHPRSLDNIISAEIEIQNNKNDLVYDFSSIVMKYSKVMELEIYLFVRDIFEKIFEDIKDIRYVVQGINFKMEEFLYKKPNLGTIKKFLKKEIKIKNSILKHYANKQFTYYLLQTLPYVIGEIQNIRNENIHAESSNFDEVDELRRMILGVGKQSALVEMLRMKKFI